MTTNALARHYEALTAEERIPLLFGAAARGDWVEHGRLVASAPRVTYSVLHTHGLSSAILIIAGGYWAKCLELAWMFLFSMHAADAKKDLRKDRAFRTARVFAYLFLVEREGWRLFCEAHGLNPEWFDTAYDGLSVMRLAQEGIENSDAAMTEDEVREFMREKDPAGEVRTAAVAAAGWEESFVEARRMFE